MSTLEELKRLLTSNNNKRITVIGTTCTGKTTIMKHIPEAVSLSDLCPPLTQEQVDYIMQTPWTRQIGETVAKLRGAKAVITAGKPAFGTVLASNTELIVYMKIDNQLLQKRTRLRNVNFADAKAMQGWIEEKIAESGLPVITVPATEE